MPQECACKNYSGGRSYRSSSGQETRGSRRRTPAGERRYGGGAMRSPSQRAQRARRTRPDFDPLDLRMIGAPDDRHEVGAHGPSRRPWSRCPSRRGGDTRAVEARRRLEVLGAEHGEPIHLASPRMTSRKEAAAARNVSRQRLAGELADAPEGYGTSVSSRHPSASRRKRRRSWSRSGDPRHASIRSGTR